MSGFKHLLVTVDQLSGWVEAFPTRKADIEGVVKALLREMILRYGIPETIESNRGSHFSVGILKSIYKFRNTETTRCSVSSTAVRTGEKNE